MSWSRPVPGTNDDQVAVGARHQQLHAPAATSGYLRVASQGVGGAEGVVMVPSMVLPVTLPL